MDDLISRQVLLAEKFVRLECALQANKDAHFDVYKRGWNDALQTVYDNAPSVQQWIPCSERMPERNGYYLVTGRQGAVNKRLYQDGYWYGNWAIIAWMPLPEPWIGENNET